MNSGGDPDRVLIRHLSFLKRKAFGSPHHVQSLFVQPPKSSTGGILGGLPCKRCSCLSSVLGMPKEGGNFHPDSFPACYLLKTSRKIPSPHSCYFRLFTDLVKDAQKNILKMFFATTGAITLFFFLLIILLKGTILKVTWDLIWQLLVCTILQSVSPMV